MTDPKARETQRIAALGRAATGGILVVEDDDPLARSIQRILSSAGYEVRIAGDGQAATSEIMERSFDVILSDIELPGMNGVDLLSLVRAYDFDVPFILMTGDPRVETAIRAIELGALQYLVKPTPKETLLQAVARAAQLHKLARLKREALRLVGAPGEGTAGDRAGLAASFDRALRTLRVDFQPIVGPRRVIGYEALLRCSEPSFPHPPSVIEAAERLDRLHELGRRVRELSASAFEKAPEDALLFVNLHTKDLLDPELFREDAPLSRAAPRVVLEITERATLDQVKDVQARVSILRYLGFRIAIDDLGAGYAGLTSFAALEPDIVKLDMSLVRNVHESPIRKRIIATLAALCAEMRMEVVAEGVEVAEERDEIAALGCSFQQGYFFARPGPPFPRARGFAPSAH
jgi:EAL domain-containing protein (putative c-di-GMP-specific phosphodiesterase class I)